MNPGSALRSALALTLSLAPLACESSSGGPSSAPASASVTAPAAPPLASQAPSASEKPRGPERGPGRGGVDGVLFRAARDLPLSDAVAAKVAALDEQLRDRDTGPRDAMKTFSNDLAAQVRTGKIDASKLQPDEAALDAAMKGMLDKQAKALAGLHDALDAGQRKALADAVHARSAAHETESRGHDGGAGDWNARRLEKMTSELGLDAGQQKQVGALLAKQPAPAAMHAETSKQIDAVLTAFQADSFDAVGALQPTIKASHDALDRRIAFTGQLLPLLHPDQREKLATSTARPAGPGAAGWPSDDEDGHGKGGGGGEH